MAPLHDDVDELWVPSASTCATCTSTPASTPTACTSCPTASTSTRFSPDGPGAASSTPATALRFLFVGGAISRKGVDVLLARLAQAFAGRDDVTLVIKDFGADGVYRGMTTARRAARACAAGAAAARRATSTTT